MLPFYYRRGPDTPRERFLRRPIFTGMSNPFHRPPGAPHLDLLTVEINLPAVRSAAATRGVMIDEAATVIALEHRVRGYLEALFADTDIEVRVEDLIEGETDPQVDVSASTLRARDDEEEIDHDADEADEMVVSRATSDLRAQLGVYLAEGSDWIVAPGDQVPQFGEPREHFHDWDIRSHMPPPSGEPTIETATVYVTTPVFFGQDTEVLSVGSGALGWDRRLGWLDGSFLPTVKQQYPAEALPGKLRIAWADPIGVAWLSECDAPVPHIAGGVGDTPRLPRSFRHVAVTVPEPGLWRAVFIAQPSDVDDAGLVASVVTADLAEDDELEGFGAPATVDQLASHRRACERLQAIEKEFGEEPRNLSFTYHVAPRLVDLTDADVAEALRVWHGALHGGT